MPHMEVCHNSYLRWCKYPASLWVSFATTDEFSLSHKNYFNDDGVSWIQNLPFWFLPFYWLMGMAVLSIVRKPDNCESHSSLKHSVTNIRGLRYWYFFVIWNKLGRLNWSFLWNELSPYNSKGLCYSHVSSGSLCEQGSSFLHCTYLPKT